jgi:hypothetical protein
MWSGPRSAVPAGWHVCDGSNGTPDLRDRFVVGAGLSYQPLDTGGATLHAHTGSIGPYPTPGLRVDFEPTPFGYSGPRYEFQTNPASSLPPYAALLYIMKL